jgi:predicted MFS family arabinose efflux permease
MRRGEVENESLIHGVPLDPSDTTGGESVPVPTSSVAIAFWKVYWVGFLIQLENNVVLPTIWDYVKNHFEASVIVYGAILSIQAASETLGALVLGFWSDRRPIRYPLMAVAVLYIIGNIIYISAWNTNVWIILLARVVSGI